MGGKGGGQRPQSCRASYSNACQNIAVPISLCGNGFPSWCPRNEFALTQSGTVHAMQNEGRHARHVERKTGIRNGFLISLFSLPTPCTAHTHRTHALPCRSTGCSAAGNQQAPHSSACSRSSCAPCINAYSHAQDSRYAKQKYWLQRCGLSRIMYLIEGDPATDQNLTDGEQPRHMGRFQMMSACDPITHMFALAEHKTSPAS